MDFSRDMVTRKAYEDAEPKPDSIALRIDRVAGHVDSILSSGLFNITAGDQIGGMADTPHRVARFYAEFNQEVELVGLLGTTFESDDEVGQLVLQTNIPFRGLCEHHLLPFFGHAHVAYIPDERVVGLSKLTRLVQAAGTRRPSIQERITHEIASVIHDVLHPKGVMVVIKALHTCMAVRGVNAPDVYTTTSRCRGVFLTSEAARMEFLSLINHTGK